MADNPTDNYLVIQKGVLPQPPSEWTKELTCPKCKCVFKTKVKSTSFVTTGMDEWEQVTTCPTTNCASRVCVDREH